MDYRFGHRLVYSPNAARIFGNRKRYLLVSPLARLADKSMAARIMAGKIPTPQLCPRPDYWICADMSEIESLSPQWDKLLAASSCNRAFGSLEWYLASCRVNSSLRPYLVLGGRPEIDCILPLVLEPKSGTAMFPHYGNDYNDVVGGDDNPMRAAGLLKYAISSHTSCHQLVLSKLRPDSNCIRAAGHLKGESDILCQYKDIESYSYVNLPYSFDSYLASLGKKFRKNMRRALRAIEAHGFVMKELRPEDFNPAELPEVFLHLFLSRHGGKGFFQDENAQQFTREILPLMFRKATLRVFAMLDAGRVIAMLLWFVTRKGCLAWNAGFLSGHEHWSPGTCLYAFAIKQAISTGVRELDFGEGDETYKSHWANDSYRVGELIVGRR